MQYQDYLQLLTDLQQEISRLIEVGQQKIEAVQNHDLDQLNECMKQEQAIALTLRGFEQKRVKLLSELGYKNVTLREMPQHCPKEYQQKTSELVERLLRAHQVLQSVETPSRTMMEQDLRTIQQELENRGVSQEMDENYQTAPGAQPPALRTAIRA